MAIVEIVASSKVNFKDSNEDGVEKKFPTATTELIPVTDSSLAIAYNNGNTVSVTNEQTVVHCNILTNILWWPILVNTKPHSVADCHLSSHLVISLLILVMSISEFSCGISE